jgi:hypothetical protein
MFESQKKLILKNVQILKMFRSKKVQILKMFKEFIWNKHYILTKFIFEEISNLNKFQI